MARKGLPGYLKHKATGQAFCVLDGRFFYLGKYGSKSSRELYEKIIADFDGMDGLTISEEGGLEELDEFFSSTAMRS